MNRILISHSIFSNTLLSETHFYNLEWLDSIQYRRWIFWRIVQFRSPLFLLSFCFDSPGRYYYACFCMSVVSIISKALYFQKACWHTNSERHTSWNMKDTLAIILNCLFNLKVNICVVTHMCFVQENYDRR